MEKDRTERSNCTRRNGWEIMVVKIKPEQLDGEIQKQLETYSAEVTKELNKNLKEVAEETAEILIKSGRESIHLIGA